MRILALDIGSKRIGVAVSDLLRITAQARDTIERKNADADIQRIRDLAQACGAEEIIIGLPLNMDGTESDFTKRVLEFAEGLKKNLGLPVRLHDERLSSAQAERAMLQADLSRRRRKGLADQVSAQIILQSYLDSRQHG